VSDPPPSLSYRLAIDRLDRFITRTVFLLDDTFRAGGNPVIAALGTAKLADVPDDRRRVERISAQLIRSALLSMNLGQVEPTGMSALPMERNSYDTDIQSGFSQDRVLAENDLVKLQAIQCLRQSLSVNAWCYCQPEDAPGYQPAAGELFDTVETATKGHLAQVFGTRVPVQFQPVRVTPKGRLPEGSDFVLLLGLVSPLVNDVHRLFHYYVQSSFEWAGGGINEIEDLLHDALTEGEVLGAPLDTVRRINDGARGVRLRNQKEVYTSHFWGNFQHLRGKVLQALRRSRSDLDDGLLGERDVANALWFMREQLFRRNR
jgi:hypothetical protein